MPNKSEGYRRKYTQRRAGNMEMWVDAPLQNAIRDELIRRQWSISDLARKIDSQPSLVSRWMQGQRPNTESIAMIGNALSLDILKLLELAGHIPVGLLNAEDDEDVAAMIVTLREITWDTSRRKMLRTLLDWMRDNEPETNSPHNRPADRESAEEEQAA